MKFSKIIALVVCCGALMGALAGCGASSGTASSENTSAAQPSRSETPIAGEPSSAQTPSTGEADGVTETEDGKILVVYYSATNNTKAVAETIAETLGADLFEIVPTEIYTDDDLNWTNSSSRVSKEHDDTSLRNVGLTADNAENWDEYDTVFIGYPIWWGVAAWPVDTFIKANDFTGKTVIPFCTSASSGLGQSGKLLADLAGTGDWQDGQRFRSGASDADVSKWADSVMR